MKSIKFILIAIFSLSFLVTSCKKEKTPEPTPTAQTSPSVTYSTFTVSVALIDNTNSGYPGTYSTNVKKAYVRSGSTILDSIVGINVTSDATGADPCGMATLDTITRSVKIQNDATNYIDIYDGTTLQATAEVVRSPAKINVTATDPSVSCYNIPGCPLLFVPVK
jgi:hypothetical protein